MRSPQAEKEFNKAQTDFVREINKAKIHQVISEKNSHSFRHGKGFVRPAIVDHDESLFTEHVASLTISKDSIANNNLNDWLEGLKTLSDEMHENFMHTFISTISNSVKKTGNVISSPPGVALSIGTLEQAFEACKQLWNQMTLEVDENGDIPRPYILTHPDMAEKMASIKFTPEQEAEMNAIIQEKEEQARHREIERLKKFKQDK